MSSSHGSQKGRQLVTARRQETWTVHMWAERDIRLVDLGQPIETWDTNCRATKVVVGLARKAAFSLQSQQNTVHPVL